MLKFNANGFVSRLGWRLVLWELVVIMIVFVSTIAWAGSSQTNAEALVVRAISLSENICGSESSVVGDIKSGAANWYAWCYKGTDTQQKAELLYKEALAITKKSRGVRHPDVGTILNNLGVLYASRGNYCTAQAYLSQALDIRKDCLSPDHQDLATTYSNLGWVYEQQQSRYDTAKAFYNQALSIERKILGSRHRAVVSLVHRLAQLPRDTNIQYH